MFIENVGIWEIKEGLHYDAGQNSLLIQIVDPDCDWPIPLYTFKEVLKLKFLDIEEESPLAIQPEQAKQIQTALLKAQANRMNVIVHCHAGICRSGAVVEYAVSRLGFQDTEKFRQPNLRVKSFLFNLES